MNIIDATINHANDILNHLELTASHQARELAQKAVLQGYLIAQELRDEGHHGLAESWEQLARYSSNIIMLDAERRV